MQMIIEEINKIEAEAKRRGIPIMDLCEEAGVNNSTKQRWRQGKTSPSMSKWQDFTRAFDRLKKKKGHR